MFVLYRRLSVALGHGRENHRANKSLVSQTFQQLVVYMSSILVADLLVFLVMVLSKIYQIHMACL
jgi:hypothetical protein